VLILRDEPGVVKRASSGAVVVWRGTPKDLNFEKLDFVNLEVKDPTLSRQNATRQGWGTRNFPSFNYPD
jgi:hypothetical protein